MIDWIIVKIVWWVSLNEIWWGRVKLKGYWTIIQWLNKCKLFFIFNLLLGINKLNNSTIIKKYRFQLINNKNNVRERTTSNLTKWNNKAKTCSFRK